MLPALVVPFSKLSKDDHKLAGSKAANLADMYISGIPVPNGFVVTSEAYAKFVSLTSLHEKILKELSGLELEKTSEITDASKKIKIAILTADFPQELKDQIKKEYHSLCGEFDKKVAVRSSATFEDSPHASFAGEYSSYLNILGVEEVYKAVQRCFASLFEARAISYRLEKGISSSRCYMAVCIQLMVESEISGILFTINPLNNDRSQICIEAGYGLGQPIVSGEITPDIYFISKDKQEILIKDLSTQEIQLGEKGPVPVSKAHRSKQKLPDKKIIELSTIGIRIEKHFGFPTDIEWGIKKGKIFILQARPVSTLDKKVGGTVFKIDVSDEKLLLDGIGVSKGVSYGPVKIVKFIKDLKGLRKGDVLVARHLTPDFVRVLEKVSAVVTDEDDVASNCAVVCRELGIPVISGTKYATSMLSKGEVVTVDAKDGKVFLGKTMLSEVKRESHVNTSALKTATKLYIALSEAEVAKEVSRRNVDGVGLLRSEFIMARIGEHPKKFIKEGREKEFVTKLTSYIIEVAREFYPRPVVYRLSDLRSVDFKGLVGGDGHEITEPHPSLGLRGAARYLHDQQTLALELTSIKTARNKYNLKNLSVMIPFVRTVAELREVKKLIHTAGLSRNKSFQIWLLCNLPTNVISIEKFLEEGVDGVSIESNDLSMLILGADRENELVAHLHSELDDSVLWAYERIIKACQKHKVPTSICGRGTSVQPDLIEKLVKMGVSSVTVNPEVIDKTRNVIYDTERNLVNKVKNT